MERSELIARPTHGTRAFAKCCACTLAVILAGCGTGPGPSYTTTPLPSAPQNKPAASATPSKPNPVAAQSSWSDGIASGKLDTTIWRTHAEGDFSERVVDVFDAKKRAQPDWRLRLRAATMNTRDDTVKFFGAHTQNAFALKDARIAAEIDWNAQANGSYLSAGLILSPEKTDGNPLTGKNWLKVEYIGVPPGEKARIEILVRKDGRDRTLFNEGWPEKNRGGRQIALQNIEISTHEGAVKVAENGKVIYESAQPELPFENAHLYLQMSSHSNYPPREIFFSGVTVSTGKQP